MGWKNSPPVFSTATETIADLVNMCRRCLAPPLPHHLDNLAETIASPDPGPPNGVIIDHISWDPSLPAPSTLLAYTDVYVNSFMAAAQRLPSGHSGLDNQCHVRRLLLHAIHDVFRPLSDDNSPEWCKPVSLKKLKAGNCSWGTIKLILGWIINTVAMTITLPPHRVEHLSEILNAFPATQRRTSIKKWHETLGELRSMALALRGSRNLFSLMQNAMSALPCKRERQRNNVLRR
jgi:hypothetical protein